jgi:hypothetical protein
MATTKISNMQYRLNYSYDHQQRMRYGHDATRINPSFTRLMELIGKAVKAGHAVSFTYADNLINVEIRAE